MTTAKRGMKNATIVICYYCNFQVPPEATDKEIKNAYKKLAKENHPDRFSSQDLSDGERKDLDIKFQRIAKAYETLKSELRALNY